MKMDIEGFETLALRGGKELLSNQSLLPCVIWFEYQEGVTISTGAKALEIFEILHNVGYSMYIVPNVNEVDEKKEKKYTNAVSAPSWGACPLCDFEARLQNVEECKSSIME